MYYSLGKNIILKPKNTKFIEVGQLCGKVSLYNENNGYDDDEPIGYLCLAKTKTQTSKYWKAFNIYILSDDEIKTNDIYHEKLINDDGEWQSYIFCKFMSSTSKRCKKVILTNDYGLDIPSISKQELKNIIEKNNKTIIRKLKLKKLLNKIKYKQELNVTGIT